jgi:hypothetical protein
LATIVLENEMLKKIDYEDIIEDFIPKNPKIIMFFEIIIMQPRVGYDS